MSAPALAASIKTPAEWAAFEQRAWHSAWRDRGLSPRHMSPDECASVQKLDAELGDQVRRYAPAPVSNAAKDEDFCL